MAGRRKFNRILGPLAAAWLSSAAFAATDDITEPLTGRREYREQGLVMSLTPRSPDQLYAFYSARGFADDALHQITRHCFLTVDIRNERRDVVWLELDEWRFSDRHGRAQARMPRAKWNALWEQLKLEPAQRATFGWTQLPEQRDLHPGEPVGGNVTLAPSHSAFTVEARFRTGADKRGPLLRVRFDNVNCRLDETS